ncbi:polysaccharide pyruvyl transferase family protein [Micrococcus luteus]|uniref:polysaccharide pyruvyl transferase family protein n=1 Tax=Micrococcus luteus TaxID=1270 RepID=UPI003018031B
MTAHPTDPRRILMVRGGDHRWVRHDRALLRALQLGGHTVVDLDLGRHPTAVPTPFTEPAPTRPVDLRALDRLVDRARPDLMLFAGEALRPDPATAADLRARGARLLGVARLPEDATDERAADVDGLLDLVGSSTAVTRPPPGGPVTYGDRIAETLDALPAPRSPRTPPRVVLVSGYYGAGNRGDELLLATLARTLEEGLEDVQVVVAANDPAAVERVHGLPAFARADLTAAEEHAARATAVVLGPGGHWHDYSVAAAGGLAGAFRGTRVSPAHMAQLPLLVAGYGGRVIVHGMGVGPLEDPAARAAVRLTGRVSHAVSVRDEASRALLEPLAADWPAPVTVAPDVVYGLDLPQCAPAGAEDEGWIAVSLRPWGTTPTAGASCCGR